MLLHLIPEYSGINKGQRIPDRSKTAHRKPPVTCFLTIALQQYKPQFPENSLFHFLILLVIFLPLLSMPHVNLFLLLLSPCISLKTQLSVPLNLSFFAYYFVLYLLPLFYCGPLSHCIILINGPPLQLHFEFLKEHFMHYESLHPHVFIYSLNKYLFCGPLQTLSIKVPAFIELII